MDTKNRLSILFLLLIAIAGCGTRPTNATMNIPPAVTATFPPSPTTSPAPTDTHPPTAVQPTMAPLEGVTSTQLNVRTDPSTAGTVLGIIPANTSVQITGRDPAGNWWQILYPQGKDGKGWVTSQYVSTANGTAVPVIGNGTDPNGGNTAVVQQQLNVRSGPGTGFNSLGTLNPKDVVRLTGRDADGAWLQVEFPSGPEGKGWVNAAFVQGKGVDNLSIISEAGEAIGTGTPTGIPATPTATLIPAWADKDSQDHPIASVLFETLGTQTFIYSGDVSAPVGDPEDWIQFSPDDATVYASIDCQENSNLQVSFFEDGQPTSVKLVCGDMLKPVSVKAGALYLIHVQATQFPGGLQYFPYTITIRSNP